MQSESFAHELAAKRLPYSPSWQRSPFPAPGRQPASSRTRRSLCRLPSAPERCFCRKRLASCGVPSLSSAVPPSAFLGLHASAKLFHCIWGGERGPGRHIFVQRTPATSANTHLHQSLTAVVWQASVLYMAFLCISEPKGKRKSSRREQQEQLGSSTRKLCVLE